MDLLEVLVEVLVRKVQVLDLRAVRVNKYVFSSNFNVTLLT